MRAHVDSLSLRLELPSRAVPAAWLAPKPCGSVGLLGTQPQVSWDDGVGRPALRPRGAVHHRTLPALQ